MANRFTTVPLDEPEWRGWSRRLALAINGLFEGKSNNTFEVTLAVAPATTTVIAKSRITPDTKIFLMAKTANAAAAVAGLYATAAAGAITLTHSASAAVDRTFAYILVGCVVAGLLICGDAQAQRYYDEGVKLGFRDKIDFTGGGVTCTASTEWITCDVPAGAGGGEANTSSSAGGGLAVTKAKVGVNLPFASFSATDFDLAADLFTIDATLARDAEVAAGYQPLDADLTSIAALTTTATGRGLLDDADATALRVSIGAVIGTDVQAWDADLNSIAALTTTAAGRGLLDDADASALRTSIGAVIDTNVQAWDADLDSIAALATTATGRGLLDDADASALRTSIGAVIGTNVQAWDADLDDLADGSLTGSKVAAIPDASITPAYSGVAACGANTWASTLNRNAVPTCTQPAFSNISGTVAIGQGGTTETASAEDAVLVGASTTDWQPKTLPSCSAATTSKLLYDNSANTFSCGTDNTGRTLLRVTGDVANSTLNFADVTGLTMAVSASTTYYFDCKLTYTTATSTTALQLSVNGPAVTALDYGVEIATTTAIPFYSAQTAYDTNTNPGTGGGATRLTAQIHGSVIIAGAGGTFAIRSRSEVNASAATVKRGSWCQVSL
jgi:hypothetical protein